MNKKIKHANELTGRFSFRVPMATRILAEKRADATGKTLSILLRHIVSNELNQIK